MDPIIKTTKRVQTLQNPPISVSMRYFFRSPTPFYRLGYTLCLIICCHLLSTLQVRAASSLTPIQSQAITDLMGSQTPLWFVDTQTYGDGGTTVGSYAPRQDKYVTFRYTRKEKGHLAHFALKQHSTLPGDYACLAKEKVIAYQHPQLGAFSLCSSVTPGSPNFVTVRAFAQAQKSPYLQVQYVGPVADLMPLMGAIRRLPTAQASSGGHSSALAISRTFYPVKKQVSFNWPGYALGDEQLFWGKPTQAPQWSRVYHKAIPYIAQGVTLHFTAFFRHTPHSQVVKPDRSCGSGETKSRYQHPQLGPYLLCTKVISTPAHASATDSTPLVHHLVYARPLAGNILPHTSFHIHGLPQDMLNMLGQVRLN